MNVKKPMPNIYILVSILLNLLGQFSIKSGVNKLGGLSLTFPDIAKSLLSPLVLGGLVAYGIGSIFWILALSHKDLSYAYPMLSVGYIIILILSWAFLGEQITLVRILGVILISFGVFLVFKSA